MISKYRALVSLIACLLLPFIRTVFAATFSGLANEYIVDHWDTESGLPQNSVTSIAQTKEGYLWIGTFDGLVRFDGISFKVFNPETSGFPLSSVTMLAVDAHQRLWIGSEEDRLLCLTASGFVDPASWGLPSGRLDFNGESPDGHVLIEAKADRSFHSLVGDRFVETGAGESPSEHVFESLRSDQRWGAWEKRGTNWHCLKSLDLLKQLASWPADLDKAVRWTGLGLNDAVWFVAPHSIRKLRQGIWSPEIRFAGSIEDLTGMAEDDRGSFWIGTWRLGLFRANASGEFERLSLTGSSKPEAIRTVFRDREGNIWIGTDGSGLFRIKPRTFQVVGPESGLSSSVVRTVSSASDGKVWVLYHGGGVDRFDGLHSAAQHPLASFDLPWAGLVSRNGTFWLGQFGGRMYVLDRDKPREVKQGAGLYTGAIRCLHEDDSGTIWVGNAQALRRIENDLDSVVANLPPVSRLNVRSITTDSLKNLYVGLAENGLLQLSNGVWKHFSFTNGLFADHIGAVCADGENVVWIGTQKKGLICYKGGVFRPVPTFANALPSYITGILDDEGGHLWLGSANGIFRIDRDAALKAAENNGPPVHVDHYGMADGLSTSECSASQPSACKSRDGMLWFATLNGIAVVDPRKVPSNIHPPPVVIERIDYDGHGFGLTSADRGLVKSGARSSFADQTDAPEIIVPAGINRLEIQYTGLSFVTPQNVRFRYRLEGLDLDWVDAGTRRYANFTRLSPGPYRFRAIACNNDGVWNDVGAALALRVLPYYWQTNWFRGLLLAVLGGVIFGFYHWRVSELERQQRVQQDFSRRLIESQEQERKRIAGELHDDLGQDLLVIKNRLELRIQSGNIPGDTKEALTEISDIASHALTGVRALARNLRPHLLDELGLSRAIEDTIRKMSRAGNVQFESQIENVNGCLLPEFEINFFRIIQEALNNIIKHSKATVARIGITRDAASLFLTVQDNGIGFEPDKVSANGGFGLSGLVERVRIMGGRCEVISEPGSGATIRITIPISNAHPNPAKGEA